VPPLSHLTEEDEVAERESRDRLRAAERRRHELFDRREAVLAQVHAISDQQRELESTRRPVEMQAESFQGQWRELGHLLSEKNAARNEIRAQLDKAAAAWRERRAGPREPEFRSVEAIEREVAQLERRQQTQVLSLADENAMIDQMRGLRREREEAVKRKAQRDVAQMDARSVAETLATLRKQFEEIGVEIAALRKQRDQLLQSTRAELQATGGVVAQIRAKSKARAELFQKMRDIGVQLGEVDREIGELLRTTKSKRDEARRTVTEYNRSVRTAVAGPAAYANAAEERLARLMKEGRVRLTD
jgi:uncharacterized coiled-coil DUF342 family protein